MTLFSQTFDGAQIFQLISLLMVLVLFIAALKGNRDYARWFRSWEAERKARREAELAAAAPQTEPTGKPRGPWG